MYEEKQKIEFRVNYRKALEALLYVASQRASVNMYPALKSIFEADKLHLNQHGRPVTGDTYIKMPYGTVPSAIYNIVKQDPIILQCLNLEGQDFPIEMRGHHLYALRKPDMDYLSESDVEALDAGIKEYLDMDFDSVCQKNHLEKCWIDSEMNRAIDFALIIENPAIKKLLEESPLKLVV